MRQPPATNVLPWVAWLLVLGGGYFLFVGQVSTSEAMVGAGAVALTLLVVGRLFRLHLAAFRPRRRWLTLAGSLPWQVLRDSVTVTRALGRQLIRRDAVLGQFGEAPFAAGGDDPRSAARRALAVIITSFPPNSYVVDIDHEQNRVRYNELVPQGQTPAPLPQLETE